MRLKLLTSFLLVFFLSTSTLFTQEERGQLWEIQSMKVPPSKAMAFEQTVMDIGALAKKHAVDGKYAWHFWSDGFTYLVASPHANFASFDDPDAWLRAFGDDGEKIGAIFQKLETEVQMRPLSREIIEVVDAWSYTPAKEMQPTAGTLYTFQIKPGHHEKFEEANKGWQEFWKAVDYPYGVTAYRTHFGELDRVQFMFFHDGLANFMGQNSADMLAKKSGKEEMHQKLIGELTQLIDDMEVIHMSYHPDMSYTGPTTVAGN